MGDRDIDQSAQPTLCLLATRLNELLVFTLDVDGVVVAAASLGAGYTDPDPDPPNFSHPPKVRMVASAVAHQGYGRLLIRRLREELDSPLAHDGSLSLEGENLARDVGLEPAPGAAVASLSDDAAAKLAAELLQFVADHPSVEQRF